MKDKFISKLLWILSIIVIAAGAVTTAVSVRQAGVVAERINRKMLELNELRNMEKEVLRINAAKRAFDDLKDKQPVSLEGMIRETLSEYKCDEIRETGRENVDGWILYRKEISFGEIPIGKLMEFINKAEGFRPASNLAAADSIAGRPPWHLAKCIIQSGRTPGTGKAVVVMEGLGRAEDRGRTTEETGMRDET